MNPDPDRYKLPPDLAQLVLYNTTDRSEYRFFISYEDWPRLAPTFKRAKTEFPTLAYIGLDDGVYFGTPDRVTEKLLARLMGVGPVTEVHRRAIEQARDRSMGRPAGSQNASYPFDELVRVGDCFLVLCEKTQSQRTTLSNACSVRNKQSALEEGPTRKFATHQVDGGVLVVLVESGDQRPARVVPYGGRRG